MTNNTTRFSQREGYLPPLDLLPPEELSVIFRNELQLCLIKSWEQFSASDREYISRDLWVKYLKESPQQYYAAYHIKDRLLHIIGFSNFFEVFDLIEGLIGYITPKQPYFFKELQEIFAHSNISYRLIGSIDVGFTIVAVTNEYEFSAMKDAFSYLLAEPELYKNIVEHLIDANKRLNEREYGKCIHELASAVEATLRILSETNSAFPIKEFTKKVKVHPIIREKITRIYDFASDIHGGRHSKQEAKYMADESDARFLRTTTHATIQYLINKKRPQNPL